MKSVNKRIQYIYNRFVPKEKVFTYTDFNLVVINKGLLFST